MEQGLDSDLPGEVKALVTSNVYDTATGRYVLIPQCARLAGEYNSQIGYAQDGVQVMWNRVIYPDGSSLDPSAMLGQDAHGFSGFRDKVDHHYKRLVGFAVLANLFAAASNVAKSEPFRTDVSKPGRNRRKRRSPARVNRDVLFESPYNPQS